MGKMLIGTITLTLTALTAGYAVQPEPQLVEYHETVQRGDTVWSMCDRISGGREHLGELVFRTMRENNIKKAGDLQPGTELVIRVKGTNR